MASSAYASDIIISNKNSKFKTLERQEEVLEKENLKKSN